MVISGHVHESPFIPNGSWFDRLGDTPAGLNRAPDEGTAFWLSAEATQSIDLKAPLARLAASLAAAPPWLTSLDQIGDPSLMKPVSAAG
jgi:hypothetical protein